MQTGSWFTIPADPNAVFEKDPARVWPEIVSALGDDYRSLRGYAVRPLPATDRLFVPTVSALQPSHMECYACGDAAAACDAFLRRSSFILDSL